MREPTYTKLSITAFECSACLCNVCGAIVLERTRPLHSAEHAAQRKREAALAAAIAATMRVMASMSDDLAPVEETEAHIKQVADYLDVVADQPKDELMARRKL